MGFAEFVGNARVMAVLQRMLATDRIPSTLLLAGQKGVGKFTLAGMFARAALCQKAKADFCSDCRHCRALAVLDDVPSLRQQALKARGGADPEEVPLVLQPHPDVSIIAPDPTYIRMSQMRAVRRLAHSTPTSGRRVIIVDDAERLRVDYASTLLKVLEEPPQHTHFLLVAHAPFELPDTIRSRAVPLHFAPIPREAIEAYLATHRPELGKKDRLLLAGAAAGSLGTALSLDLERYRTVRQAALDYLRAAAGETFDPAELFAATMALAGRSRRGGEEDAEAGAGRAAFEFSLELLYSVLSDVLYLKARTSDLGLHNSDVRSELEQLSHQVDWQWLAGRVVGLDSIVRGLRRNLNRQLALDALALARSPGGRSETFEAVVASE